MDEAERETNEVTTEEATETATTKPINQLSLTELATEYNRRAEEIEANSTGLKPVKIGRIKGFKDRTTGIRRLKALNGEIEVVKKKRAAPGTKTATKPKAKVAKIKAKIAPKQKVKSTKYSKREFSSAIGQEFGFKAGGDRDQLLLILSNRMGRQVHKEDLGDKARLTSKIELRIKRKKLPYRFVKEKDDEKNYSYGLYRK